MRNCFHKIKEKLKNLKRTYFEIIQKILLKILMVFILIILSYLSQNNNNIKNEKREVQNISRIAYSIANKYNVKVDILYLTNISKNEIVMENTIDILENNYYEIHNELNLEVIDLNDAKLITGFYKRLNYKTLIQTKTKEDNTKYYSIKIFEK